MVGLLVRICREYNVSSSKKKLFIYLIYYKISQIGGEKWNIPYVRNHSEMDSSTERATERRTELAKANKTKDPYSEMHLRVDQLCNTNKPQVETIERLK